MRVEDCDFETLLALADQMPRERFEQIKTEQPDFAAWLNLQRAAVCMERSWQQVEQALPPSA